MTAKTPGESNPMNLLERDLVFLDCEMTGGSLDRHDIIEIGAVRARLPELTNLGQLSIKWHPAERMGRTSNHCGSPAIR